jgi:hypothetical protein
MRAPRQVRVTAHLCLEARAARSNDNKRERRPAHATARRHCTPARPHDRRERGQTSSPAPAPAPADRTPNPQPDFIVWNPPSSTSERVCLGLAQPPLSPSPTQPGPRSCLQFAVRNHSCHFPTRRFCLDAAFPRSFPPDPHSHPRPPPHHPPLNTPRLCTRLCVRLWRRLALALAHSPARCAPRSLSVRSPSLWHHGAIVSPPSCHHPMPNTTRCHHHPRPAHV